MNETPPPPKTSPLEDDELFGEEAIEVLGYEELDGSRGRISMKTDFVFLSESRPDIMFCICLCARFQEVPKTSHLEAVKRIFRYIKGITNLGLWYPMGSGIETIVYADSDHAGDY
ncbi:hypothetical protein Tco_0449534 [Tanacetum coccineum]